MRRVGRCRVTAAQQLAANTATNAPALNGKIRVAQFGVIACPILCFRKNDSAQDFAALHLR